MAVDADSYGTIARLETLVGDVLVNTSTARTFSATTVPTLGKAEELIDDIAAELNTALTQAEYSIPVTVAADKAAFNYLRYANVCGAAVLVLDSMPTESYAVPGEEAPAQGRKQHWQQVYLAALKLIKEEKLVATRATDGSHLGPLKIGSETNSDGDTKLPVFTRATGDYPGSRSLTKE